MDTRLVGCGLSSFEQFQLIEVYRSSSDDVHIDITTAPDVSTGFVSVIHRDMARITAPKPLVSVNASLAWDATFIRIKTSEWSVCLASSKWADQLQQLKEEIVKVWETSCGLLVKCANGTSLLIRDGARIVINKAIDQYCSLTGNLAYTLLSDGKVCQCALHHPVLDFAPAILPSHHVKQMDSGTDHIVLVTESGSVYSFGVGTRGQLGHGDLTDREHPCLIEALAGIRITHISCGNWHSMALSEHGDIYSWGMNNYGQLGHSSTDKTICPLPKLVSIAGDDVNFTAISCGSQHSAALTKHNNILYVWGWDKYHQTFHKEVPNVEYFTCGPWCTVYLK